MHARAGTDNLISVEFDHIMERIYEVFHAFKHTWCLGRLAMWNPVIEPFRVLDDCLGSAGIGNEVKKSGPMAGRSIQNRFFVLAGEGDACPTREQPEILDDLADQ
jgi:hypothetical protein